MVSAIWKITTFVKKLHEKTLSANQITDELQMKCAKIKRDAAALQSAGQSLRNTFSALPEWYAVDGFQHIVRCVAHAFLSVFIRDTDCQHDRGVHVPQIVEAEVRNPGLLAHALKALYMA